MIDLTESAIDWNRCGVCRKLFRVKETKVMNKTQDGFLCMDCDGKKNGGVQV